MGICIFENQTYRWNEDPIGGASTCAGYYARAVWGGKDNIKLKPIPKGKSGTSSQKDSDNSSKDSGASTKEKISSAAKSLKKIGSGLKSIFK